MIRAALRFIPRRWSGRHMIRPYIRFRIQTMYGGPGELRQVKTKDVLTYLRWVRDFRRFERFDPKEDI